ncbi:MAG TPA: hypothetical protein VNJ28_07355 [Candidatus Limnocylindrales bacterium]|jgi:hypothetical protein|nr:hypothetical protein [Candidatus Limnocylindrales bacterium]
MSNREAEILGTDARPVLRGLAAGEVRFVYQRLRMAGLTGIEAGNLTAHLAGLRVARKGWTVQEIESLLFIRALVDGGRLRS